MKALGRTAPNALPPESQQPAPLRRHPGRPGLTAETLAAVHALDQRAAPALRSSAPLASPDPASTAASTNAPYTFKAMADNQTFVTAPPGLTATLKDGTQLPIVAFRVDGRDLLPYYLESDGSVGQANPAVPITAAAAWNSLQ